MKSWKCQYAMASLLMLRSNSKLFQNEGMRLYGKKGMLELWDHNCSLALRRNDGSYESTIYYCTYEDTLWKSWEDFIYSIKNDRRMDKVIALANIQAIDAAYQSVRTGIPVEIENPI